MARPPPNCSTAIAASWSRPASALLRGHVSTQTLHPQWTGYGYTWQRQLNAVHEQQFARVAAPASAGCKARSFT